MRLASIPECDPPGFLAWEETLLEAVEDGAEDLLWFWEPPTPFVVVGYGQSREREAHLEACARAGVPVLRRASGGGTVLQGPGCLSYGLALRIHPRGPLESISGANRWILSRMCRALEPLLGRPVSVQGHTDLTVEDPPGPPRKFSGNAQRRTRQALLFHGTLLLHFDLRLLAELLPPPSWAPEYRSGRGHGDFLVNLGASAPEVRRAIVSEWGAVEAHTDWPVEAHRRCLERRYGRPDWHARR